MALGAISSEGARPLDIVTGTTTSATDWEDITLPKWAREVTIQNTGGSTVYIGKGMAGAWSSATPGYRVLPGDELTVPLTGGQAQALQATDRTLQAYAGASGYALTMMVVA